jgi:cell wall-active antibiotic response 4TMS protein YvqF
MKTFDLLEPLNGVDTARVEITSDTGNLTIDKLDNDVPLLASGTLQYDENQHPPTPTLNARNGQANLTLTGRSSGRPWLRLPWAACNAANEWQIHLNPLVASDITAHSGGGNVKLDLSGMAVIHVSADTGGGNMEVVLPDNAPAINVQASTGAGNVVVHVPSGVAVKVHATSGLGKVSVDPRFNPVDHSTYESPDYEHATHRVELTLKTGAGNVSVETP